jgi:flagellar protein FliO/FliZ
MLPFLCQSPNRPMTGLRTVLAAILAGAAATAAAEAPARLVESPLSAANLADTAIGLLIVLGLMLGLAWLVKRYARLPGIGKGQVQILGGVSLGARERAVLLSVEGRRLLVGVAPGRVQTLLVLGAADQAETADDFASSLEAAEQRARTVAQGEPA